MDSVKSESKAASSLAKSIVASSKNDNPRDELELAVGNLSGSVVLSGGNEEQEQ